MIWLLRWLIFGPRKPTPPSCKEGGPHRYRARFDEFIDPRFDKAAIESQLTILFASDYDRARRFIGCKIYVKDICDHCGDVVERLEGLNAMQVLAHASKRIKE